MQMDTISGMDIKVELLAFCRICEMAWQNEDSLPRRINQSGTKKDEIGTGRSKSNSSSGIGDDHDISSQSSSSSSAASAFIAVDCPYHNHRPSRPRGRRRIESDTITIISKDNHLGDWTTMTEPPLPKGLSNCS